MSSIAVEPGALEAIKGIGKDCGAHPRSSPPAARTRDDELREDPDDVVDFTQRRLGPKRVKTLFEGAR